MQTILEGRQNRMPAHEDVLTPDQIKILTAWVGPVQQAGRQAAGGREDGGPLIADLYVA